MSLIEEMSRDREKRISVNIEDIRVNPYNFYPFEDEVINSLALSIKQNGQLENATVYEDIQEDGRQYTLLGGESRYRAITKLVENNEHDGMINVVVVNKPNSIDEEMEMLLEDNIQRHKNKETILQEVQAWERIYSNLENRPTGRKRDWIALKVGVSGRYVDMLLNSNNQNPLIDNDNNSLGQITNEDIEKSIKRNIKALEKTLKKLSEINDIEKANIYEEVIANLNNLI